MVLLLSEKATTQTLLVVSPESQDQNLVLILLHVPYWLGSGWVETVPVVATSSEVPFTQTTSQRKGNSIFRTFTRAPRPESGLDCLMCTELTGPRCSAIRFGKWHENR